MCDRHNKRSNLLLKVQQFWTENTDFSTKAFSVAAHLGLTWQSHYTWQHSTQGHATTRWEWSLNLSFSQPLEMVRRGRSQRYRSIVQLCVAAKLIRLKSSQKSVSHMLYWLHFKFQTVRRYSDFIGDKAREHHTQPEWERCLLQYSMYHTAYKKKYDL